MAVNLLSADATNLMVYKHDGFSNVILETLDLSVTHLALSDITWVGNNLYTTDPILGQVNKHDGFSTTILASGITSEGASAVGLTDDGINLYRWGWRPHPPFILIPGAFIKHNGLSLTSKISFFNDSLVTGWDIDSGAGLAWDGTNLLAVNWSDLLIYKLDGFSATILTTIIPPGTRPGGLTWYDGNLYSADYNTDTIYKHDGFSTTILDSFSSPGTSPSGLAFQIVTSTVQPRSFWMNF